jgi:hypothetical protein
MSISNAGSNYVAGIAAALRLDARELDHRGPFLDFGSDEFAEIS